MSREKTAPKARRPAPPGDTVLSLPLLHELAGELGLDPSPRQCQQLLDYGQLLQRWNRVHNLTARDDEDALLSHHLLDCLAIAQPLLRALEQFATGYQAGGAVRFLDAGSGAGLPGIPLAVLFPHWRATLIDAVQKKCAFLLQTQIELGLSNVAVHHARLETSAAGPHDLVLSRAFASLADFVRLTRPLLRPQGLWAAMKGRYPAAEVAAVPADVMLFDTITLRVPRLTGERRLMILGSTLAAAKTAASTPACAEAENR